MINHEYLAHSHKENCKSKDSLNIIKKNIQIYKEGRVECEVYCAECGNFLYYFCWGHEEH